MKVLLIVVVMLLPLLVGVLAFVLAGLRDDVTLFEEGGGRLDTFIQVFLDGQSVRASVRYQQ